MAKGQGGGARGGDQAAVSPAARAVSHAVHAVLERQTDLPGKLSLLEAGLGVKS